MTWSIGAGLEGKGVVVTGAAGGIGRAVVRAFDAAGARVCATDTEEERLHQVVSSLGDPTRHVAVVAELGAGADCERLLADARGQLGRLDVLAHVAATLQRRQSVWDITEADWDRQLEVNLKASFFLNRAMLGILRQQGRGGRIVNFTSTGWWTAIDSTAIPYCASKAGVVTMSRGLAREVATEGITVNTIAPGAIATPMMREGLTDEQLSRFAASIPVGRLGEPEEVAGAVVFLASDHASYITGATLNISGGHLMY
jgi:NAD(P)-dependent dehydrogenase (short-subunit alcohol dehydrogenase family)